MARRVVDDSIHDLSELRERFLRNQVEVLSTLGILNIHELHKDESGEMYVYFTTECGIADRIYYTYNGMSCDHVVKGKSLDEIYRDMEFVVVNYIFGIIC